MGISIICCVNESFQIGNSKTNDLLYKIKLDLKRFRSLTLNNFTVYGRRTFESLPGLFDNRTNVILTQNKKFQLPKELTDKYDVIVKNDLSKIINHYQSTGNQEKELFLCGGAGVFAEGLHYADNIYLTMVHELDNEDGDVYFPKQELSMFKEISREKYYDENLNLHYSFINYVRK